mmetsp:Transcript_47421/g.110008  ORF Transcript_47421/g.110008 Transcript_47421/m.110008 type:complete len:247 (-) Transcript_47421:114-854(-)
MRLWLSYSRGRRPTQQRRCATSAQMYAHLRWRRIGRYGTAHSYLCMPGTQSDVSNLSAWGTHGSGAQEQKERRQLRQRLSASPDAGRRSKAAKAQMCKTTELQKTLCALNGSKTLRARSRVHSGCSGGSLGRRGGAAARPSPKGSCAGGAPAAARAHPKSDASATRQVHARWLAPKWHGAVHFLSTSRRAARGAGCGCSGLTRAAPTAPWAAAAAARAGAAPRGAERALRRSPPRPRAAWPRRAAR